MLLITHIHEHISAVLSGREELDPYYLAGLVYPDIYLAAPSRVAYEKTHPLPTCSERAMTLKALAHGRCVARFADGMGRHLRDDQLLAELSQRTALRTNPLAAEIVGFLKLRAAVQYPEQVRCAILPPVTAGVLEFSVAGSVGPKIIPIEQLTAVIDEPRVMAFVAYHWSLKIDDVKYINGRWRDYLSNLPRGNAEDVAWFQMNWLWPRYATGHLRQDRVLTARETIRARRQWQKHQGEIAGLLYGASSSRGWPQLRLN